MSVRLANGFVVDASTGSAIRHDALRRLPFEKRAETWVRTCFPDASYAAIDAEVIEPIDACAPGIIALQGPKGLGKSKAIRSAVMRLSAATTVVQVTFRRSLAASSAEMLGANASIYSSVPGGMLSARQHPRLTIVVNSIARIRGAYDVVIIDEVVSVIDMLSGALLNAASRTAAVATIAALIQSARTVIVADAVLDAACLDFVLVCRGAADARQLTVLDYTRRLHASYVYVAHALEGTWMRALEAALSGGKRVVVPCMTKNMAQRIAQRFQGRFAAQVYTGDTADADIAEHMRDIHRRWCAVQLLVYSPVITAGCSFEQKHFDCAFFFGFPGLGSVRSAIQMIARVRDLRDATVHVYIANAHTYDPPAPQLLPRQTLFHTEPCTAARGAAEQQHLALLRLLDAFAQRERALAKHAFAFSFWSLVVHSGARVAFERECTSDSSGATAADASDKTMPTCDNVDKDASADVSSHPTPQDGVDDAESTRGDCESVPYEHPLMHAWDDDAHASVNTPRAALDAKRATLMQRAACVFSTAMFHGLAPVAVPLLPFGEPELSLARHSRAAPCAARVSLWRRLCVSKGFQLAPDCHVVCGQPPRASLPWSGAAVQLMTQHPRVHVRCIPAVACAAGAIHSDAHKTAFDAAMRRYQDPHVAWLDALEDAWLLAGIMDFVSKSSALVPERAIAEPMRGAVVSTVLEHLDMLWRVLARLPRVVYCAQGAVMGTRGAAETAVADMVLCCSDRSVHVLSLQQSTSFRAASPSRDLFKMHAMYAACAVPSTYTLGGVHVVYADGAFSSADAPSRHTAIPEALALDICASDAARSMGMFAVVRVDDTRSTPEHLSVSLLAYDKAARGTAPPLLHKTYACATPQEALQHIREAKHSARKLCTIVWGWSEVAGAASAADAVCTFDVQQSIGDKLGLLDASQLELDAVHCYKVAFVPSSSEAQKLASIVDGILSYCTVVVFWESKPHGLQISTLQAARGNGFLHENETA